MMAIEAWVLYKKSSYLGLAKKVNCPGWASSILPKDVTVASVSPSMRPFIKAEI
jgi:hypothetical protein